MKLVFRVVSVVCIVTCLCAILGELRRTNKLLDQIESQLHQQSELMQAQADDE